MKERHLIGFSLSLCLQDILRGLVDKDEVLFIQTGCCPVCSTDIEQEILGRYKLSYFKDMDPKAVQDLFDELYADHRIGWASNFKKNTCNIAWGHWLSTSNRLDFRKQFDDRYKTTIVALRQEDWERVIKAISDKKFKEAEIAINLGISNTVGFEYDCVEGMIKSQLESPFGTQHCHFPTGQAPLTSGEHVQQGEP